MGESLPDVENDGIKMAILFLEDQLLSIDIFTLTLLIMAHVERPRALDGTSPREAKEKRGGRRLFFSLSSDPGVVRLSVF